MTSVVIRSFLVRAVAMEKENRAGFLSQHGNLKSESKSDIIKQLLHP